MTKFTVFSATFGRDPSARELREARKVYDAMTRCMERHQCRWDRAFDAVLGGVDPRVWRKMRYIGFDLSPVARPHNGTSASLISDDLRRARAVLAKLKKLECPPQQPVRVTLEELGL